MSVSWYTGRHNPAHLEPNVLLQHDGAEPVIHGGLCKVRGQLYALGPAQLFRLQAEVCSLGVYPCEMLRGTLLRE